MRKLILGTGLGYDIPTEEQIKIFAELGWDGFFTGWNEQSGNLEYKKLSDTFGLEYQSIHAPFDRSDKLWEMGNEGDREAARLIRCLEEASLCEVPIVVMHTIIGMEKCTPNDLGVARFSQILDRAASLGVTVALENTEGEVYLERLLSDLGTHPAVGFCIDTGHEMCYNECRDLITKYGRHLVSTHLNDNLGKTGDKITFLDDSHLLPFDGIANWQGIANRLMTVNYSGALTFELITRSKPGRTANDIYRGMSLSDFAAEALTRAKKFREMCK